MDIVLINPYPEGAFGINEATVEAPFGILYIASFLEAHGFQCDIIDANVLQLPTSAILEKIKKLSPEIVGISVNAFSYQTSLKYARNIKIISKDIIIILGGPHATSVSIECLRNPEIDAVVVGEGEITTLQIMENWRKGQHLFKGVKGLVYRGKDEIEIMPLRERIKDLDTLPFPAYHLLPDFKFYKSRVRKKPFMGLITSRGCPYHCIYCSKDVFKNKIILRSAENVVKEIDFLVKHYSIRQIDILDDNFAFNRKRTEKICDLLIERNYKIWISLQSGIRADGVDARLMKKLRQAGVFKIAFGVETGDEKIMKSIKKNLDLDKVIEASRLARANGMIVIGFFMIGFPGDDETTLQKTIDLAKRMDPYIANFMMTIPFFGTELYNIVKGKGKMLIDTKDGITSGFYSARPYFEFEGLSSSLLLHYYKKAYRDFYFRPNKIWDILKTIKSISELKWFISSGFTTLFP